ncbi:MAG: O-antigen ligase family protein [Sphingomicrobium sp.]
MANSARSAVAPLYLFACLILGGSAQGIWQNALLQLAGLAIIVWAAAEADEDPLPRPVRPLLLIVAAAILIVMLQSLPLPPSLWAHGARARIAEDYRVLGQALPALPVSLTPYASLNSALGLIPPLAVASAVLRLKPRRASWLAAALLAGAIAGVMLGALQVVGGSGSPWYLYAETNVGLGVGFFANANHMADLLVIALPFVAAIAAAGRSRNLQRYSALLVILAGVALVLVVGIALNGSLAGYALAVPVLAASALIMLPPSSRWRRWIVVFAALSVVAAVAGMASSSIGGTGIGQDATSAVQSREHILQTTGKAITDYMPFGSGLGSFLKVYRQYESPETVTNEYVIHAHNDYAEIVLELGVAGILLLLLFLGWWVTAASAVWRQRDGGPYARAATIATAAVLVHSLVDFPLRTAAISTCFAMCLALIVERREPERQDSTDIRPARHIVVS